MDSPKLEPQVNDRSIENQNGDYLVRMLNIHKWFGKVYALRGVDFQVRENEIVGLVSQEAMSHKGGNCHTEAGGSGDKCLGDASCKGRRVSYSLNRDGIKGLDHTGNCTQ